MKITGYQRRFYRGWVKAKGLHTLRLSLFQTDLEILTDKPADESFIKKKVLKYRWDIENYIAKDNRFLTGLKPIAVELNAPLIVRDMARVAYQAGVGPMAAVAGAIAQFLGRDLLRRGFQEVIIENGGDIFMRTRKKRSVRIYTGKTRKWQGLSLEINPADTPLGICTSSGTVGHSLSFGSADAVVILARKASLADAAATAVANRIRSEKDLVHVMDFTRRISGVTGVVLIYKSRLASWGRVKFCR
ncbi:MAG: UPF0280 family protein [Candidatus Omnitrophota bacterium]